MTCSGVCHFRMIVSWPREVHNGGWDHVSPNDDCNLYALRFTFWHAGQAGDREAEVRLGKDPSFVRACNDFGVAASTARHHSLAMELFDLAVWVGRQQARVGATDRSLALDAALSNCQRSGHRSDSRAQDIVPMLAPNGGSPLEREQ